MPSQVHLLLGFPGTGKYTVAKALAAELERRGEVVRLVDSHYVNNPIFGLINKDGVNPLPSGTWEGVSLVREAILQTIESLSPPEWSFVFTNNLMTGREMPGGTAQYVERLHGIAEARGGRLRITRLTCDATELVRRIEAPDRARRLKATSAPWVQQLAAEQTIYDPPGPALTMDITQTQPHEAALHILEHPGW